MTEVLWEPRRQCSASRIAANREQSARKMDVQMPNAASAMGEQSRGLFPLVTRGSCGCFKFSEMHNMCKVFALLSCKTTMDPRVSPYTLIFTVKRSRLASMGNHWDTASP